jgi:hypothetical protein
MPVIQRFLTDTVVLERRTGTDAFDGNAYAAPVSIPARLHSETTVVRGADGREITSSAHVSTTELVSPGDRVTDVYGVPREVLTVRINKRTNGEFSHYVGFLA